MQDAVCSPGPPPQTPCGIQLLGELRLTFAGQEMPRAFTRKLGGLLGYLACFLHRVHSRDTQFDLFWPEADLRRESLECLPPDNLTWRSPSLLELGILYAERGDLDQAAAVLAEAIAATARSDSPAVLMRASHANGVTRARLHGARLSGVNLIDGDAWEVDLSHADLRRATLSGSARLSPPRPRSRGEEERRIGER